VRESKLDWMPSGLVATLNSCGHRDPGASRMVVDQMADDFVDTLDNVIHADRG
jgi:hypothetical protein